MKRRLIIVAVLSILLTHVNAGEPDKKKEIIYENELMISRLSFVNGQVKPSLFSKKI
jgi:hypothetical protein